MRRTAWLAFAWGLLIATVPAAAQQRPGPPPRAELEARIRARFEAQVGRELGLSDPEVVELRDVIETYQEQRRSLFVREAQLRRRLRADLERSQGDARTLLQEMRTLRKEEARLFEAEMEALLGMLSPDQVLRFYELRDEFMARVRRLRGPAAGPWPEVGEGSLLEAALTRRAGPPRL